MKPKPPPAASQLAAPAPPAAAEPPSQVSRGPTQLLVPNGNGLAILVDNSIVALSQANVTQNYSVLHDLGSPDFQKLNSPQHLAEIFAGLRQRGLNMTPLVLYQPRLKRPAMIDDKGVLRIAGFYDTRPLQIHFDLAFQAVEGAWRLYEIAVFTAQPQ
jgi:hypothetical protein